MRNHNIVLNFLPDVWIFDSLSKEYHLDKWCELCRDEDLGKSKFDRVFVGSSWGTWFESVLSMVGGRLGVDRKDRLLDRREVARSTLAKLSDCLAQRH